jgi:hypothetical protein
MKVFNYIYYFQIYNLSVLVIYIKVLINTILILYLFGVLIVKSIIGSESLKFAIIYILSKNQLI